MALLEDNYLGGSGSRGFGKVVFKDLKIAKRGQEYYKEFKEEDVLIENASLSDVRNYFKN